jgi:POT family proton-dependent oligopeptide transporter
VCPAPALAAVSAGRYNHPAFIGSERKSAHVSKHPRGLYPLFFTEMWERFSFYCMLALLTLYMDAPVREGGLGFDPQWSSQIYGLYKGFVYFSPLFGGLLADRLWGYGRTIIVGGLVMMAGHLALAGEGLAFFFVGLACLITGNGLFKPNISTMVGNLYRDRPALRDQGFSIFYMGINMGAFVAPLVANFLKNHFAKDVDGVKVFGWHYAFGVAAIGMIVSVVIFLCCRRLVAAGELPSQAPAEARREEPVPPRLERMRVQALFIIFGVVVFFWMAFNQNGVTLVRWARDHTEPFHGLNFKDDASLTLSINPFLVIVLTPLLVGFWAVLRKAGLYVSTPRKMLLGMLLTAGCFGVMALAAEQLGGDDKARVTIAWLLAGYVLVTIGELCLSPMGLSVVSKLAPQRHAGLFMGGWFVATALGTYLSGFLGMFWKNPLAPTDYFLMLCGTSLFAAVLLFLLLGRLEAVLPREQPPAPPPPQPVGHEPVDETGILVKR